MNCADRFVHKAFDPEETVRKKAAAQQGISDRPRRRRALLDQVLALLLRKKKDPPEDPYAYSMVRVKPRLPQLSRGATAELDN